jgi:hypothetical protein
MVRLNGKTAKMHHICKVEGCGKPATAKALCSTHYMRQLRTGNTFQRRRPGRKVDAIKKDVRKLFSEWSPRTFETYWRACERLRALCQWQRVDMTDPRSPYMKAHKVATRDGGSINVARLAEAAESMCGMYLARLPDEPS